MESVVIIAKSASVLSGAPHCAWWQRAWWPRAGCLSALLLCALVGPLGCGPETDPDTNGDPDSSVVVPDGGTDAMLVDASPGLPDGGGASDAAPDPQPAIYPSGQTHSPITPYVAAHLADVLAVSPSGQRDVFIKVGDSISASTSYLNCLAGTSVNLDTHSVLQATRDYFVTTPVGAMTSFDRDSDAVEVGRTAWWAITGTPSPLDSEMTAVNPSAAVVMFGTNDIGWFGDDHESTLQWYYENYLTLVDTLVGAGIVPILSTIPPRDDSASHDAWVPALNAMVRGVAQGRQIPLVDFHRELMGLADHGLSGDGMHPTAYFDGAANACDFSPEGLLYGYNVRNLITLESLDRVRSAALAGTTAPDPVAPHQAGLGTAADPYIIETDAALYTHMADTAGSASSNLSTYSGCASAADESGPEILYEMTLTQPSRVRALVFDVGDVDVDIHLLDSTATEAGCLDRGDTIVEMDLTAGTYYFSLDT
jgi:GDSL-like Lipase/Acylhydrolase family